MEIAWQLEDDIFVISPWGLCILFLFYDQPKMVPDTSGNCVVSLKLQNLIILEKIAIEELHQQLLTFTRPEGKRKVIWNCPIIIRSYQTAIYSPSQSAPTILLFKTCDPEKWYKIGPWKKQVTKNRVIALRKISLVSSLFELQWPSLVHPAFSGPYFGLYLFLCSRP